MIIIILLGHHEKIQQQQIMVNMVRILDKYLLSMITVKMKMQSYLAKVNKVL